MNSPVTATGQERSRGGGRRDAGAAAVAACSASASTAALGAVAGRPRPRRSTSHGAPSTISDGATTPSRMSCRTRTQMKVPDQ